MRYDAGQKEKTRLRLLRATAESLRARGVAATTIGGVTAAAGITHGGFYAHFRSRDDLVAAGVREMFSPKAAAPPAPSRTSDAGQTLAAYVDFYLSRAHRDRLSATCPVPLLVGEAERLPDAARSNFAEGLAGLTALIRRQLSHAGRQAPEEEAHSILAELVGALALARAEPDPEKSDARLEHSRRAIRGRLGLGPPPPEGRPQTP
jgi:TetR/AcrR family transcriptional repressor of nem operon